MWDKGHRTGTGGQEGTKCTEEGLKFQKWALRGCESPCSAMSPCLGKLKKSRPGRRMPNLSRSRKTRIM
jgi:hypothetical protein